MKKPLVMPAAFCLREVETTIPQLPIPHPQGRGAGFGFARPAREKKFETLSR
jgi:hypothetical protein